MNDDIYIRKILAENMNSNYRVRSVINPELAAHVNVDIMEFTKRDMVSNLAKAIIHRNNHSIREIKHYPEYYGKTYEANIWNFTQDDLVALIRQAFNDGVTVGKTENSSEKAQ